MELFWEHMGVPRNKGLESEKNQENEEKALVANREHFVLLKNTYSFSAARSTSSGLSSSCRVRASSRLISSFQSIVAHEEIVRSVGMIGFCPYISSAGMNPITELYVVRSTHNA
jgi:hypothetical protein